MIVKAIMITIPMNHIITTNTDDVNNSNNDNKNQ